MIAVVTPSLPDRTSYLNEACQSVAAQELKPAVHLIGIDHGREGSSPVRNRLVKAAEGCEWVAFLDDDDLLYPGHLQLLSVAGKLAQADVVYPYCDVQGRDWNPSRPFDERALRAGNYIPVTVLIRRQAFLDAGGFRDDVQHGWEDWNLWLRLLDRGARFVNVPAATWLYRFHDSNKTYG